MFSTLAVYTVCLLFVVTAGVSISRRFALNHRRTQMMMSLVSGTMLGIAVFHLLPHALYGAQGANSLSLNADYVAVWLMAGILSMFLLQRIFHFHQHDFHENYAHDSAESRCHGSVVEASDHNKVHANASGIGGIGVLLGLAAHSVIDGLALAVAIIADSHSAHASVTLAGLGVFIAIALHKPLDAITIDMFAKRQGIASFRRHCLVLLYGLICPLSAVLVMLGVGAFLSESNAFIVAALAFSAGIFLCISLSDLLPEIHFHRHDRLSMSVALLLGVSLAYGITFLESEANHHMHLDHEFHEHHHSHHNENEAH